MFHVLFHTIFWVLDRWWLWLLAILVWHLLRVGSWF